MAHLCTRARILLCREGIIYGNDAGRCGAAFIASIRVIQRAREIREFLISLLPRLPCEFDRINVVCKGGKARRLGRLVGAHTLSDFRSSRNYFGSFSSARYAQNCGRIREHPPRDFHYQRQRWRGPPCSG